MQGLGRRGQEVALFGRMDVVNFPAVVNQECCPPIRPMDEHRAVFICSILAIDGFRVVPMGF
jgi:hypothetical protein